MKSRLEYGQVFPEAIKGLIDIEKYVANSGLDIKLYELVKMRASQINGCAFCLDMHSKDARKAGETEQRLYTLSAWWETPFFTEKEQAALQWTETLTMISEHDVEEELYETMLEHFSEQELMALTMAIVAINAWNRLAKPFRTVPGTYNP